MGSTVVKGGCFCGAVTYEATGPSQRMLDCFCTDCQHALGGGPAHLFGIDERSFRLTSGSLRTFTYSGGSGHPVDRLFCGDCGAPVAARPTKVANLLLLIASTLNDPSAFQPQAAIWTGSAQTWHQIPDGIPSFPKGRTA